MFVVQCVVNQHLQKTTSVLCVFFKCRVVCFVCVLIGVVSVEFSLVRDKDTVIGTHVNTLTEAV